MRTITYCISIVFGQKVEYTFLRVVSDKIYACAGLNFKCQIEALFRFFCMKERLGPHVTKVYEGISYVPVAQKQTAGVQWLISMEARSDQIDLFPLFIFYSF